MTIQDAALDLDAVESFAEQLGAAYVGSITSAMVSIGHQTRLFEAAAPGPVTSANLADRAGLHERYVREWLGSVTTAGIFRYDAATSEYTLPPEHAVLLTGPGSSNLAAQAPVLTYMSRFVEPVIEAFRGGGGVPYDRYRPEFTSYMAEANRRVYDECLVKTYLPMASGLTERLHAGATGIDLGTGTGHPLVLLARTFPESTFTGFDLAADAIAAGTATAAELGLTNLRFEQRDVATIADEAVADVVFAFDAIHDQADPATVLRAARRMLKDDGVFIMVDIKASSHLEDNCANPLAPLLYGISVLHCMTVSLADGGAGLGTAWGEQLACEMLRDAGFSTIEVNEIPADPFNIVYVCRA